MKKTVIALGLILIFSANARCATVTGGVSKADVNCGANQIVDNATNMPVANAKVSMPKLGYYTVTDDEGRFNLATIQNATILSVEKEGYRPFSLTVNQMANSKPIVLGIQKSDMFDVVIESDMMHLGDDNYSPSSANAGYFQLQSKGPSYSKQFVMKSSVLNKNNYLVIGSILGIDTLLARSMGQNKIVNAYSSPPEVYFNGTKIAEIQLNGDNQKIKLPNRLIKANAANEITIKTGRNLMQRAYIDYDDIEIANLSIMTE